MHNTTQDYAMLYSGTEVIFVERYSTKYAEQALRVSPIRPLLAVALAFSIPGVEIAPPDGPEIEFTFPVPAVIPPVYHTLSPPAAGLPESIILVQDPDQKGERDDFMPSPMWSAPPEWSESAWSQGSTVLLARIFRCQGCIALTWSVRADGHAYIVKVFRPDNQGQFEREGTAIDSVSARAAATSRLRFWAATAARAAPSTGYRRLV